MSEPYAVLAKVRRVALQATAGKRESASSLFSRLHQKYTSSPSDFLSSLNTRAAMVA